MCAGTPIPMASSIIDLVVDSMSSMAGTFVFLAMFLMSGAVTTFGCGAAAKVIKIDAMKWGHISPGASLSEAIASKVLLDTPRSAFL